MVPSRRCRLTTALPDSEFFLFGGFRVERERDGQIWLTGKRGPAIIAYLARCPGMAAPREKLADLLWGDSDSEHSRNSLRQTLSVLRRDLMRAGVDIIQSRKDMIGLKADAVGVDVEEFEAGLAGPLRKNSKGLWRFTAGRFSTASIWEATCSTTGQPWNATGCWTARLNPSKSLPVS